MHLFIKPIYDCGEKSPYQYVLYETGQFSTPIRIINQEALSLMLKELRYSLGEKGWKELLDNVN
jgi:hypothetical protein